MKNIFIIFFLFLGGLLVAQNDYFPRTYIAYQSIDSIVIDGKANEDSWKKAGFSEDFIDIEGVKIPQYCTNVKMLWDESYLYFYAKMEEPHVWATLKQRDTVIFYNNDFEIFIDPDGDTHNYMELEMNALNTIWDLFIVKPYREPAPIINNWDIHGLKSAVYIDGSLNDPSNKDKFWSVEVAIPWEVLEEANIHGNGHKDEFWRINFSRVNWDFQLENNTYSRKVDNKGEYLPEYNWVWSPQGIINMHEPEHWGYVFFSTEEVGNQVDFKIPEEEKIKWALYKIYRSQKQYYQKQGSWAQNIDALSDNSIEINGATIYPVLETHLTGWNISIESPFSEAIYIIKEDGKFVQLKAH